MLCILHAKMSKFYDVLTVILTVNFLPFSGGKKLPAEIVSAVKMDSLFRNTNFSIVIEALKYISVIYRVTPLNFPKWNSSLLLCH